MRDYSVLSGGIQGDVSGVDTDGRTQLETAMQRFTAQGTAKKVAYETRARLHETIAELTQDKIEQIAVTAEQFAAAGMRVFLEVRYGDAIGTPQTQLHFADEQITAQYTTYMDEEEGRDKRLLHELRRIQYLQHVVMKQLEMTDRSGSMQVVQGMVANGQKFIAGLTAIFKQVEVLAARIEKGLQHKSEMPSTEQKTVAIAAITKALRELPAIDAKHIALKNMVKVHVEQLQNHAMPQTARVMNVKTSAPDMGKAAPIVRAAAQVKNDVKVEVKGDAKPVVAPIAKSVTHIQTHVQPQTETRPVVAVIHNNVAHNNIVREMGASIAATTPRGEIQRMDIQRVELQRVELQRVELQRVELQRVELQRVEMPRSDVVRVEAPRNIVQQNPVAMMQQRIVQEIGVVSPVAVMRSDAPIVQAVSQSTPQTASLPVQTYIVQNQTAPVQPVSADKTGVSEAVRATPQTAQHARETVVMQRETSQPVAQAAARIFETRTPELKIVETKLAAEKPVAEKPVVERMIVQTPQRPAVIERVVQEQPVRSEAVISEQKREAKIADKKTEGDRVVSEKIGSDKHGGEKEIKDKKEAKAEGPCGGCASAGAGCVTCRVSSLQGKGTATVVTKPTAQMEKEAKAQIKENAAKCAGCGGCGPGGCSRVAADPNAVTASHNATLDKLGARRRAAPQAAPRAA